MEGGRGGIYDERGEERRGEERGPERDATREDRAPPATPLHSCSPTTTSSHTRVL